MPRPLAAHAHDAITIGSASKSFWGGLRLGWLRVPRTTMDRLLQARMSLDLGAPVLEQLALAACIETGTRCWRPTASGSAGTRRPPRRSASSCPSWRFRRPAGGLALWCQLPEPRGSATTAEAERRGVVVAAGPVFAVEGGLDHFVRIPWTRPADELTEAVSRLAAAWANPGAAARERSDRRTVAMVRLPAVRPGRRRAPRRR